MNEGEATLFLADMLDGMHQADSRHEKHCFLERVPVKEEEMVIAYLKAEYKSGQDYTYTR